MWAKWENRIHFPQFHFPHSVSVGPNHPHSSLCNNQVTALTNGKWEIFPLSDGAGYRGERGGGFGVIVEKGRWRQKQDGKGESG